RHTEINKSFGDSFVSPYFDFSDQTIKDNEKDEDDIQEILEEFINGDIQKITEPQLPELINLINNNETVKDSFEYNPESVFALNNIMKYIDNKFYEIVNDSIHFNLSDVKNFSAYDIHSSKKESLSNGTIYKKFN